MSASKIIHTLWAATLPSKLSVEQLEELSRSHELADNLSDLADMLSSTGCLVAKDGESANPVESFQGADSVSQLLFTLADSIQTLAAASFVSAEATTILKNRLLENKGATP